MQKTKRKEETKNTKNQQQSITSSRTRRKNANTATRDGRKLEGLQENSFHLPIGSEQRTNDKRNMLDGNVGWRNE